jgi:hypothetical protein
MISKGEDHFYLPEVPVTPKQLKERLYIPDFFNSQRTLNFEFNCSYASRPFLQGQ